MQQSFLTAQYINKQKNIDIPEKRKIDLKKTIELTGATGNNLKDVDVIIPLEIFCCITGVSGSGKSYLRSFLKKKLEEEGFQVFDTREIIISFIDKLIPINFSQKFDIFFSRFYLSLI